MKLKYLLVVYMLSVRICLILNETEVSTGCIYAICANMFNIK